MKRIEKTIFISYRRKNAPWALAIFQDLTPHGYDVFFDFNGIASGDFEHVGIREYREQLLIARYRGARCLSECGPEIGDVLGQAIYVLGAATATVSE